MVTFEAVIADLENKKREQSQQQQEQLHKETPMPEKFSEETEQKQHKSSGNKEVVIEL